MYEITEVTTWSQLSQVKSVDVADFNSWDVSNSSEEGDVLVVVDKEGTFTESVSSVSELSFTSSDGLGVGDSFDVFVSTESLQEGDNISGLFDTFDLIIDNQWKVGDSANSVT